MLKKKRSQLRDITGIQHEKVNMEIGNVARKDLYDFTGQIKKDNRREAYTRI